MNTDHITNNFAQMSVNNSPSPTLITTPDTIIEEMACAIAEAQAALFAGRFGDLEESAVRLQELCRLLKNNGCNLQNKQTAMGGDSALHPHLQRVLQQNKVFAAVLRRMKRHLETLRGLLHGPALTYEPVAIPLSDRKN